VSRLKDKYRDQEGVRQYLDQVQQDVVEHLDDFRDDGEPEAQLPAVLLRQMRGRRDAFVRYRVNLLVDHSDTRGAPVVVEPNPTYYNLVGKVEYRGELGTLHTDFTMVKPGALHRANGGYLVLQARDVLTSPFAWDALKRTLKSGQIRTENIHEQYGLIPTASFRPEPIPSRVKVVLVGNPLIYYVLYTFDEDFRKLFKVRADFDTEMDRTPDTLNQYASVVASICHQRNLPHFDRSAVARVVDYSSRLAEDQTKLSARFNEVTEIIYEAAEWARHDGRSLVTAQHVSRALEEKIYRSNRIEEKIRELIARGSLLVDVEGATLGQVNGLAVLNLGDYAFGKPNRITARSFVGARGVVNIERETDLSGRIHSKGVMILGALLGGRYAQDKPLSLSATLTFEQLYDEVDGDSASVAEFFALLSELSGLPIDQGIAVTGSVNQKGEIQPVGGINQKVEGFYYVCKVKGLTGRQGVIVPHQNVPNLMLRDEVCRAITEGRFHVWAIRTIDEGIALLTGVPAGEPDARGRYPRGTVNELVDRRLRELAQRMRQYARPPRARAEDDEDRGARRRKEGPGEPPGPPEPPEPPEEPPSPPPEDDRDRPAPPPEDDRDRTGRPSGGTA